MNDTPKRRGPGRPPKDRYKGSLSPFMVLLRNGTKISELSEETFCVLLEGCDFNDLPNFLTDILAHEIKRRLTA